jgi:Flp pilus assembly protein TadG
MAEFALVLPVLALLAVGVIDLGRAFSLHVALAGAAGEAARYCARHAGDAAGTLLRAESSLDGRVALDPALTECPDVPPGSAVTVVVGATFTPATPLIASLTGGPLLVAVPATTAAL